MCLCSGWKSFYVINAYVVRNYLLLSVCLCLRKLKLAKAQAGWMGEGGEEGLRGISGNHQTAGRESELATPSGLKLVTYVNTNVLRIPTYQAYVCVCVQSGQHIHFLFV